jgi:hypothetical protein
MKTLIFILCLFLSIKCLAQNSDTVGKDTSKHFMIVDARPINKQDKPLIVVDGIIYNGDLKKINPKDILRVDVLKPPGATNIYGDRGEKGVILISTRFHKGTDTIKKSDTVFSKLPDSALYVIDGLISDKKLTGIAPQNILSIDILKKDKAAELFEGGFKNGVVIVVTKSSAIKSYQNRLGAFSQKYKEYLQKNQNDDKGLVYILNGIQLKRNSDETINILHKIHNEDIKTVGYSDNFIEGMKRGATIFITTRK